MKTYAIALALCAAVSAPAHAIDLAEGTLPSGSAYEILKPDVWNGDLVLYFPGIQFPGEAPAINAEGFPLELLVANGFAVATTSYPQTGWVMKEAGQDPHFLRERFEERFGPTDDVLLIGASLGGIVAAREAEGISSDVDGALLLCPPVAGLDDAGVYHLETALLFDAFFPGVIGLDPLAPPAAVDTDLLSYQAVVALQSDPLAAFQLLSVLGASLPGAPDPTLSVESIVTSLVFWYGLGADILDRANGMPFDTTDRVYTGSFDDAALNAAVGRAVPRRPALNYADRYYEPTGELLVPTVIATTVADPVVPVFNTFDYAGKAAASGTDDLLAVLTVDRYGHCAFEPSEIAAAITSLAVWVEYGVPATSGDITAPTP